MAIKRGFVQSLDARDDGWVELTLLAAHAGNATSRLLIQSVDGDLTQANRRLAKLALLRDALARTLPVEITYESTKEQGDVIDDVTIFTGRSIAGRSAGIWETCRVLSISVRERGPEEDTSPYVDEPDEAMIVVLLESGDLATYMLDLQRPHASTAYAMLDMLKEARRTLRPIKIQLAANANERAKTDAGKTVVCTAWPTPEDADLRSVVVFIERIGRRADSLEPDDPLSIERVVVKYTTAPDQLPEGDHSENGSFTPASASAWVHADSVLLPMLWDAMKQGLQVKLGLKDDRIEAAEVISKLGSAARPIWIELSGEPLCEPGRICTNDPTTSTPDASFLAKIPQGVVWRGCAFFNEGIWRFVVDSASPFELTIDGVAPCCPTAQKVQGAEEASANVAVATNGNSYQRNVETKSGLRCVAHAYLCGLHRVELTIRGRTCQSGFDAQIYRIR